MSKTTKPSHADAVVKALRQREVKIKRKTAAKHPKVARKANGRFTKTK